MIYRFVCDKCKKEELVHCTIEERNNQKKTCCGEPMYRAFSAPKVVISNRPFDFGKGMNADKEQQQILERTGGWDD